MSILEPAAKNARLDADEEVVYGPNIDRDLDITDRSRRKYIARGILPKPDGYIFGRAFWLRGTYAKFKRELLSGKYAGAGNARPGERGRRTAGRA